MGVPAIASSRRTTQTRRTPPVGQIGSTVRRHAPWIHRVCSPRAYPVPTSGTHY
jgi:hypothetical protein